MEMISFVKRQRQTIAIIADKVDRVQRSFKEYPLLNDLLEKGKIELHFNTENYYLHRNSNSQERMMWAFGILQAQSYIEHMRDNLMRSNDHKLRKGEWISIAPVGYLKTYKDGKFYTELDPQRAPLVQRVFEEYATGKFTLSEMAQKSKKWGLDSERGEKEGLSKSQVHRMIKNPFYYGVMRVSTTGKEYPHIYEPIISRELFDQCQIIRKSWGKKPSSWGKEPFLFRGILTCAITGRVVSADRKKRKRADGTPYSLTYLGTWNPDDTKKKIWVREEEITKAIDSTFDSFQVETNLLKKVQTSVLKDGKEEKITKSVNLDKHKKQQKAIKEKMDRLTDLWLDKVLDTDEYKRKRLELVEQQNQLEAQMVNLKNTEFSLAERMVDLTNIFAHAKETFSGMEDLSEKRDFLNFMFSEIRLKGRELQYKLRFPFD